MQNRRSYTNVVVGVIITSLVVAITISEILAHNNELELAKLKAHCIENAIATNTGPDNCDKITN